MNIKEVIQYWLTSAEDDIRVAQHLYDAGDYPQALFFGHLYLEKVLKALVVQETETHAPYSHNLLSLAGKSGIELSPQNETDLDRITKYNIETRYPEDLFDLKQQCTEELCQNELGKIKELAKWFKKEIRL